MKIIKTERLELKPLSKTDKAPLSVFLINTEIKKTCKCNLLLQFTTENFYRCTKEILVGLGQMYVCKGKMKEKIDRSGGKETTDFTVLAINAYCQS